MEEMSKKTKRLEKENLNLTRKQEATNKNIFQMAEERSQSQQTMDRLSRENDKLKTLCRAMQTSGYNGTAAPDDEDDEDVLDADANFEGETESEYDDDDFDGEGDFHPRASDPPHDSAAANDDDTEEEEGEGDADDESMQLQMHVRVPVPPRVFGPPRPNGKVKSPGSVSVNGGKR